MNGRLLVGGAAVLMTSVSAQAVPATATLCEATEHVVFSCDMGRRVASLCMATGLDGASAALRYRFGRPGSKPELEYPSSPVPPTEAFTSHFDMWAKGMYSTVSFSVGKYSYTVYSRHAAFEEDSRSNGSGVRVLRGGGLLADRWCTGDRITDNIWAELGPLHLTETRSDAL